MKTTAILDESKSFETIADEEKKPLTPQEKWLMKVFGTTTPNRHQRRSYKAKQRHQKKVSKQ